MEIPRPEYPRPQFARSEWFCLNGEWQFELDSEDSGLDRGLVERELANRILVPFCPESELSGLGITDFMPAVWYRRTVTIPENWARQRVLLHFQAVDYDATVWVNGREVGRHRGGFTPFTCDLSDLATAGQEITIVVRARDDYRPPQPRGKQSQRPNNYECFYTRTTGIWQTVWLEPVPEIALCRPRLTPDTANSLIRLEQRLSHTRPGLQIRAILRDDHGEICRVTRQVGSNITSCLDLPIPASRRRLWSPADPYLYDLEIQLLDPEITLDSDEIIIDQVTSYAGLRSISIDGLAIKINGETIFQRLVLDQGFYPDGILTAPDDTALRRDIEISLEAGFNGARLHQKIFEERFLYHADRLGYLVWGEFPDWGCKVAGPEQDHQQPGASYMTQWLEALERDYSHPCIIGWCPLNETWQSIGDHITTLDDVTLGMFLAAKAFDGTRPVLDASGYSHRVPQADVYDCHDYEQDPVKFAAHHTGLAEWQPYVNGPQMQSNAASWSTPYRGQPFFVSEFGGIWWNPAAIPGTDSWGYGKNPVDLAEFYARFQGLCDTLLDNPAMFGYCYTQLTDVYQEQNGIYTFERQPKFDLEYLRAIQQRPAAIEVASSQKTDMKI